MKEESYFLRCKAQIMGTQFFQLSTHTQTRKWKRWISTGCHENMHAWWHMIKQKGKGIVNSGSGDMLILIQYQNEVTCHRRDGIDKNSQNSLDRWRRECMK